MELSSSPENAPPSSGRVERSMMREVLVVRVVGVSFQRKVAKVAEGRKGR